MVLWTARWTVMHAKCSERLIFGLWQSDHISDALMSAIAEFVVMIYCIYSL